jgi:hypothetical protein
VAVDRAGEEVGTEVNDGLGVGDVAGCRDAVAVANGRVAVEDGMKGSTSVVAQALARIIPRMSKAPARFKKPIANLPAINSSRIRLN